MNKLEKQYYNNIKLENNITIILSISVTKSGILALLSHPIISRISI